MAKLSLRTLTLVYLSSVPSLASELSSAVPAEVFDREDECLAAGKGEAACAFNALQLRGAATIEAAEEDDAAKTSTTLPELGTILGADSDAPAASEPTQVNREFAAAAWSQFMVASGESEEADFAEPEDDTEEDDVHPVEYIGDGITEDDHDDYETGQNASLAQLTPKDTVPVTGCHENATVCPDGMHCIVKPDKTFSQCMSCGKEDFDRECQKLDDFMRWSAIRTCKRSCLDSKCYNKKWCFKPYRCIVDTEEKWGQCINCHSKKFWKASCFALKEGLLEKAEKKCHRKCGR